MSAPETTQRPAVAGEWCTCGRAAVVVFASARWGETGYCGRADGGQRGPCVWCGGSRHEAERCPQYRIREAAATS